jgi:hypothetical protein
MKNKTFYIISAFVAIVVSTLMFSNPEFSSLFDSLKNRESSSNGMPVDMATTPKGVKDTISELESYRSHLGESCIYGAAMMLNDLGNDAKQVIEDDRKCIHTLVMSVIRDRQLKITARRLAEVQRQEDELAESSPKVKSSEANKSEKN